MEDYKLKHETDSQAVLNNTKVTLKSYSKSFVSKTILFFGLALLLTFFVAYFYPFILNQFVTDYSLFYEILIYTCLGACVGLFIVSIMFMFTTLIKKRQWICIIPYTLYSILIGLMLSPIVLIVPSNIVAISVGITAGLFILLGIVGLLVKTKIIYFIMIALVISLVATVLALTNLFLNSELLYWLVSYAIIAVIMIYVIIDVNLVKNISLNVNDNENNTSLAVMCAFNLYSDFIRLFIFILRIVLIIASKSKN